jgi:hypothetical protein
MDYETHQRLTNQAGTHPTQSERAMDTPNTTPANYFPPELLHLLRTARQVIDQHVSDGENCACCGQAWPCQRARLAEHALAAV